MSSSLSETDAFGAPGFLPPVLPALPRREVDDDAAFVEEASLLDRLVVAAAADEASDRTLTEPETVLVAVPGRL
eukprot:CAMPEP_0197851916 /NCGR_PEP_ID=MMETSP1438-20131217/19241_1 /TAXON_ID=1461541 /ORGANISM="Pterosperma sp., Strain CCMP1384" /LENGTH=73 /DNA_ID=CAMNT_0043465717 /DNA_START=182 /DNA_END=403 /DNA_ORIENTATION=+